MGQILGQDRIATPSHSSGTITLPPSLLTLGGRQYRTSTLSRLISADVTLAANVLYFVYAQLVGGVPVLRISTSQPSAYVLTNLTAKLVAAFYSNSFAPVGLGSFVTIEGAPTTRNVIEDGGTLTAFFAGFPSFTITRYNWSRIADLLTVSWRLDSVTGNATSARLPLPRNIISEDVGSGALGTYAGQNGGGNASGGSMIGLGSSDVGFAGPNLTGSAISLQTGSTVVGAGAPSTLTGQFRTHIAQWSATPLKDL